MSYLKPFPVPDPESAPFWSACQQHRLTIQRCTNCMTFRFPATSYCAKCNSTDSEWVDARGHGRVFSWIVVRHPVPREVYMQDVPYIVALVTLDEGVRMVTNIEGCSPEDIIAEMPVTVVFRDIKENISLPVFQPATG